MTAVSQPLDTVLREAVDSGDVPTVVAVAADNRAVIYEGAAGPRAAGDTEPVGAHSTTFCPDDAQRARCVPVHTRDEHGAWVATDIDWDRTPKWWPAGHGLYSTPRDFLRLQRMLLSGGTLDDARILAPSTVREAFTDRIGDLWFPPHIRTADPAASADFTAGPGMKWGWGLLLNTTATPGMRYAGSGGWAGMFNTYFWVDPHAGLTAAFHTQTRPFVDPRILRVHARFERALYAALDR